MKDEKKKRQTKSKIVPFDIDKTPEDDEIDRILSDSMNEAADQYEEEMLSRNPELKDVHAPDDLYASIVQKLKEQGAWEEDEEIDAGKADIEDADDGNADTTENVRETREIHAEEADNESAFGRVGENQEEISPGHMEASDTEQDLDALYAMLPEEDQRALEIGRQIRRENEVRQAKRKRRSKVFKYGGLVAAMLVIVCSVSMTSEANRRLVLQAWDGMMANLGFRVTTDYKDVEIEERSKTKEEEEAMETIRDTLGIPVINFDYLPEGMEYQSYEIEPDIFEAVLFYTYQEKIFQVTIVGVDEESVSYYAVDSEATWKEKIVNLQEFEANIWEVNADQEEETYMAEIDYDDFRYILNGMLSLEEMEKILKSVLIL